jgi:hypothetical protein
MKKKIQERVCLDFYGIINKDGNLLKVYETKWLANRAKIEIWPKSKVIDIVITYKTK